MTSVVLVPSKCHLERLHDLGTAMCPDGCITAHTQAVPHSVCAEWSLRIVPCVHGFCLVAPCRATKCRSSPPLEPSLEPLLEFPAKELLFCTYCTILLLYCCHHHKHQGLDPLICSVSRVIVALSNVF